MRKILVEIDAKKLRCGNCHLLSRFRQRQGTGKFREVNWCRGFMKELGVNGHDKCLRVAECLASERSE